MNKLCHLTLVLAFIVMIIPSSMSTLLPAAVNSSTFSFLASNHAGKDINNSFLAYAATATITKTSSGRVASDLLRQSNINTDFWYIGGDAIDSGAPYSYSEDSTGLHLPVQAPSRGQWEGLYAESPNSAARLYHAVLSIPFKTTPDNWWDTGMYIQTSSPMINYVTCAGMVSTTGVY